jgi:hypothetical protein
MVIIRYHVKEIGETIFRCTAITEERLAYVLAIDGKGAVFCAVCAQAAAVSERLHIAGIPDTTVSIVFPEYRFHADASLSFICPTMIGLTRIRCGFLETLSNRGHLWLFPLGDSSPRVLM